MRNYAKFFFALALKSKLEKMGCTGVDAERMKQRMSWTLRLFGGGTFEEFLRAFQAVLEHHFDNHELCATWCTEKSALGTEKKRIFRCKEKNKDMYLCFKKHHDQFMQEDSLREPHHSHDTNHVEAFNKLITKFLPKDRTY